MKIKKLEKLKIKKIIDIIFFSVGVFSKKDEKIESKSNIFLIYYLVKLNRKKKKIKLLKMHISLTFPFFLSFNFKMICFYVLR